MEPLDGVDALARIARMEVVPTTNVRVGPLLRASRAEQQWRLAPFAWSAALSAAAACIILVLALRQTQSTTSVDSISPLFNATQVQMP
jgi:hypothetical protein